MYGPVSAIPNSAATPSAALASTIASTAGPSSAHNRSGCVAGSTEPVSDISGNSASVQSALRAASIAARCVPRFSATAPFSNRWALNRIRTQASEPRGVACVAMIGAALLIAVGAEAAVVIGGSRVVGAVGLVLTLVASAAWLFLATDERADRRPRLVLLAIGAALVIAVAFPPRNSHDLWSYVMYGRTLAVHHVSPYVHPPSEFGHDVFLGRVQRGWRHTPSVYGPLFTVGSALIAKATGESALRTRLAFQGLAALSIGGALALVWWETRSARALVFLGLNPAIITSVVNGGHNDALVGLAVLAGALLAARRRFNRAGFVLALGLLVKASAAVGLIGVVAWTLTRDRRGAVRVVAVATVTTVAASIPAGVVALRNAVHAGKGNTHASLWDPITTVTHVNLTILLVLVLALAALAAYLRRDRPRPSAPALAATTAYLVGGAYVLPWYSAWALPLAAVERRSRLAWLVAAQSVFLVAVYEFELPAHPTLKGVLAVMRTTVVQLSAWALLAAFLVILFGVRGRRAVTERPPP